MGGVPAVPTQRFLATGMYSHHSINSTVVSTRSVDGVQEAAIHSGAWTTTQVAVSFLQMSEEFRHFSKGTRLLVVRPPPHTLSPPLSPSGLLLATCTAPSVRRGRPCRGGGLTLASMCVLQFPPGATREIGFDAKAVAQIVKHASKWISRSRRGSTGSQFASLRSRSKLFMQMYASPASAVCGTHHHDRRVAYHSLAFAPSRLCSLTAGSPSRRRTAHA